MAKEEGRRDSRRVTLRWKEEEDEEVKEDREGGGGGRRRRFVTTDAIGYQVFIVITGKRTSRSD